MNDFRRWNRATSNTLIQIIPNVFNGIQIRAFGRLVINKCNVMCPEEIHSVSSCKACGITILKKSDIGIILKQWDNVPRKYIISVALGIQISFDNNEISSKAMCDADPEEDRTPTPKTISFKYTTFGITFISLTVYSNPAISLMNGKPRLVREKNAIPLLSKPVLACMCLINTIYTVTSCQNTTNIWMTCTSPTFAQAIAQFGQIYGCYVYHVC